jgi:two-component system chemotaxis response regulator CheB
MTSLERLSVEGTRRTRVMVVDDSPFVRSAIARILATDATLELVAEASGGDEALRLLSELAIDVVTLDLAMPGLDGAGTLGKIRALCDVPVVVLSALAREGSAAMLQAFALGAYDVIPKPPGGPQAIREAAGVLLRAISAAAAGRERARLPEQAPLKRRIEVVLIGISTGGPSALQRILPALPGDFPVPMVVLQHMPPGYTKTLAERIDRTSALHVCEAQSGDLLTAGRVLVAPSGRHLGFRRTHAGVEVVITDTCPIDSYYRPCIDFTYMEAARVMGSRVLGLVMTGMGRDGARGLAAIKAAGGVAWAQDEATSVIYGMPRAAAETAGLDAIVPLHHIPERLVEALS